MDYLGLPRLTAQVQSCKCELTWVDWSFAQGEEAQGDGAEDHRQRAHLPAGRDLRDQSRGLLPGTSSPLLSYSYIRESSPVKSTESIESASSLSSMTRTSRVSLLSQLQVYQV